MKAAQIDKYGGVEVIEINGNATKPSPKENQVLVQVKAASINPFDVIIRSGMMQKMIPLTMPFTLGGDFAGIVVDTGEEVFGGANVVAGGSGAMADFAVVNKDNVAAKPKTLDFEAAASMPLVGSSAVQALEEHMKLQRGQKVLIHGGAGGIGSVAIQLAKHLGAYVATTVSTKDVEFAKQLGADEVVDFKVQKFEEILKDFDAVYDTVGGDTTDKSFAVLKKGGVLVSMKGQPKEELTKKYEVTGIGQMTKNNSAHQARVAELVDSGVIKPQVDKVFPLDQTREAFDYQETSHPRGKVVVKVM